MVRPPQERFLNKLEVRLFYERYAPRLLIIHGFIVEAIGAQEISQREAVLKKQEDNKISAIEDISNLLEPIAKKYEIPSMAGLLIKGDKIVMQGVTGIRKRDSSVQSTMNNLWHIGSSTKSLTAALCAILIKKKLLKWDLTLIGAFPV